MDPVTITLFVIIIVAIIAMFIISARRNKKREEDAQNLINAVKPGNKVKTIGGVCGIVVEVDEEDNTFVLETGSETSGKCYVKFDRQAIYQTDAVVEKSSGKKETESPESDSSALPESNPDSSESGASEPEDIFAEQPAEQPAEPETPEQPADNADLSTEA